MKFYKLLPIGVLLFLPLLSCADNINKTIQNEILPLGDILTISTTKEGKSIASYFSTKSAKKDILAKRIIYMLKSVNASKSIITFSESRLHRNRRLKKSQFKLPLTDDDGTVYEFVYRGDLQSGLFVLNYRQHR